MGISAKNVVLLENKTRNLVRKWDLKSLLGWKAGESNGSSFLLFSESSFNFVCESSTERARLQDTIKQCVYQRNCEVNLDSSELNNVNNITRVNITCGNITRVNITCGNITCGNMCSIIRIICGPHLYTCEAHVIYKDCLILFCRE